MQEIGGYFGLEQLVNNEYYKELLALNTGSNALLYLLKARNIRKVYIPYYLCSSVNNVCKKNDVEIEKYHINSGFMPLLDKEIADDGYVYIVNYFGQLDNQVLKNLQATYKRIIVDNTQAFFQKPITGIDTIYSCRKYFGVPDGAYLSTTAKLNSELLLDKSKDRMFHLLGRYEEGLASEYYDQFIHNETILSSQSLKHMSKLTKNILGGIDYERVKRIRDKNYAYLDSLLSRINTLQLTTPQGPFVYPLYLRNGTVVRQRLAKMKIYVPMLWPNVLEYTLKGSIEYDYASNILPLPCDQRYGVEDMDKIVSNITLILEEIR